MRATDIKAFSHGHPVQAELHEKAHELGRRHWRRSILMQLALFLVALLLWPVPILNPVKLLVVVIHEVSHVAAAYLSGGVVFGIAIDPGGAGATIGMGGNPLLIAAAGYVGSLAAGVLLYALVTLWEPGEVWCVLCAACCLSLAFGWLNDFTVIFGYGTLGLMLIGAFKFADELRCLIVRWVATTCCLYPALDVLSEIFFDHSGFRVKGQFIASDVSRLAHLTGLPTGAIGAVWILVGLAAVGFMIIWSANREAEGVVRRSFRCREVDEVMEVWKDDPYNPHRWTIR